MARVITISSGGARASIAADFGFNCFSFQATPGGKPVEALWAAPDFAAGQQHSSGSGIPLLFPFAGRIGGTSYEYEGKRYELQPRDAFGNAIHGFVLDRPWRTIEEAADRVTGQFQASLDHPQALARWPADFRLTVSYQAQSNSLLCETTVENPDDKPLPFGLGAHPYFRVPLGREGSPDNCRVTVPVTTDWELVNFLPTGRELRTEAAARLREGIRLEEMQLDHVFGGLQCSAGTCVARIDDPQSGRALRLSFSDQFSACVVYNPSHRQAVCIEPYTTVPNPFALLQDGVDPGLRVLAPGERFQARFEIELQ